MPLFGLKSGYHESGRDFTIGKVIALARDPDKGSKYRDVLKGIGLRLDQRTLKATDYVETYSEAWLAVANKHPQLEKLFVDYPQYQAPKRAQILQGLKRMVNGVPHVSKATEGPMKFDGTPSRLAHSARLPARPGRRLRGPTGEGRAVIIISVL